MEENNTKKTALIIGAGPAGLSAAVSLLRESDNIKPIIIEADNTLGGISRTIDYDGNKTDIGPHRFFSKNKRILDFWFSFLPLQGKPALDDKLLNREIDFSDGISDPETDDKSMLKRRRYSRIYYLKKFFDYPIKMNFKTIFNLGLFRTFICGMSYIKSCFIKRKEISLEDFMINRFGKILYSIFFEHYTQKVWGRHPKNISKEWGEQRIKGLSLLKTLLNKFSRQKETSLIEEYYYPKYAAGQLWEEMAKEVLSGGGEIHFNSKVTNFEIENNKIVSVIAKEDGVEKKYAADYIISSMPVKDLIEGIDKAPADIKDIAHNLPYRDYILVSFNVKNFYIKNNTEWKTINSICPDSWIYIQDRDVTVGRIYIPKSFSPYLSKKVEDTLIGMEYFCNANDEFWNLPDDKIFEHSTNELIRLGGIKSKEDIINQYNFKIEKAYPAYFDSYKDFDKIKNYIDSIENLYCIGRNGQHKYNNMDHSTLSGIVCSDIIKDNLDKKILWDINTEQSYQETK